MAMVIKNDPLAEYLAQEVQARLVLVGRSGLPPRDQWEQWMSDDVSQLQVEEVQVESKVNIEDEFDYWDRLAERIDNRLKIKSVESYRGLEKSLDQLCSSYIYSYFTNSGIDTRKGQTDLVEEVRERLSISPVFTKFYSFMLKILSEDRIVDLEDGRIRFLKDENEVKAPSVLSQEIREKYPGFEGLLDLLEYCASSYREALIGEIEATGVLYPDGSDRLLAESSQKTVEHDNTRVNFVMLREMISTVVRRSKSKRLRILEVGAGTGGLTRHIVSILHNQNVEYYFTDIGRQFVVNAEREASKRGWDFVRFGVLDISKDPTEQGYERRGFDIVLGYNVVHATRDIRETLDNLERLLISGGLICLIEPVKPQRWIDMIWGLAKGWWHFEDKDLRRDSPLLSLDQWEKVLHEQGFERLRTYPQDKMKRAEAFSGLIIVQQKPGIANKARLEGKKQEIQNKIKKVRELEALGAEILISSADVTDQEQMRAVVGQACERFGTIHGVIHTAAVPGGRMIQLETPETAAEILAPKVKGTFVLEDTFKDLDLDFLMLFSSLTSILGAFGHVCYCAANAFLDVFAHYSFAKRDPFVMAINWDRWQNVGMAVAVETRHEKLTGEESPEGMLPREGADAFGRILCRHLSQVIVSTRNFRDRFEQEVTFTPSAMLEELAQADLPRPEHPRPELKTAYVAPRNDIEQNIADIWQEALGIEQVGIYDNFFELGGDSLLVMQVVAKAKQAGLQFIPHQLLEHQTIAELAAVEGAASVQAEQEVEEGTASLGFSDAELGQDFG
jgi:SAM-dependent methyltransferase/acyl carrier protein